MLREFNVHLEDVEMLGGADSLLEGTNVTKVVVRGDSKLSSLNSFLKDCNEIDRIDGELDLDGVRSLDNAFKNTPLMDSVTIKNINNNEITAIGAFDDIEEVNVSGICSKPALQNIISSTNWNDEKFNYINEMADTITSKSKVFNDVGNCVIRDTLEQKAKGIEIIGQTYENLVVGSGEATLLDELTLESVDGSTKEFNPHIEQPVCVETIEGETYQNLVDGKGEYKLTDTFGTTWTESSSSIDNAPAMVEVTEIWGNTIQDENDLSNIQSVGDLYVDENNELILDDEGNEQYKLEVESIGKNLLTNRLCDIIYNVKNWRGFFTKVKLKPNTEYTFSAESANIPAGYYFRFGISHGDSTVNNDYLITHDNRNGSEAVNITVPTITVRSNSKGYIQFYNYFGNTDQEAYDRIRNSFVSPQLEENNVATSYEKPQSNKTTLLMPCQLMKVSGGSDKLLWDIGKNKYIIEKNVRKMVIDGTQNFASERNRNGYAVYNIRTYEDSKPNGSKFINDTFPTETDFSNDTSEWMMTMWSPHLYLSISNSRGNVKEWFKGNPTTVYYHSTIPEIIETKVLEKPSLQTYQSKTYISTSTEVQPSQMTITNKKALFKPLSLSSNTDYTLQLDAKGVEIEPTGNDISFLSNCITSLTNMTMGKISNNGSAITIDAINGSNDTYCFMNFNNQFSSINKSNFTFKCDFNILSLGSSNNRQLRFQCEQGDNNGYFYQITPSVGKSSISIEYNYISKKYSIEVTGVIKYSCKDISFSESQYSGNAFRILTRGCKVEYSNMYLKINNDEVVGGEKDVIIKPLVVDLGGTVASISPTIDGFNHYNITIRTPATLTNETLELSGEGVVVNGVMLFQGGSNDIKQEVGYVDGIESIGELQEDGSYKIDILSTNGSNKNSKTTILLPHPLNKIGNIKDKFYWDDDKKHYCIEQNISENLEILSNSNIIDLPHLNKKYSLDTYIPTTYVECSNLNVKPSRLLLESDITKYKPISLKPSTDYTVQFDCKEKSDKKVVLNLGGTKKEFDAQLGLNHVSMATSGDLTKDKLYLSGAGNTLSDIMLVEGEMNQYPSYFDGVANTGVLQDDKYKIDIKTNEGYVLSVKASKPLEKGDKLYWNKSNRRYEIDRNGDIEVPAVEGDIIDLPRLYQREDTNLVVETGNIKPSNIKIEYNDLN